MNMGIMKLKGMFGASVCVVLLAASAAAPSLAGAEEATRNADAAMLVKALSALENGRAEQAVELYTRLVNTRELAPELLARALLNRGLAHQKLGHHAAAITDYDAALRIDALATRARVKALYNRALAFRARGDAGRAIEDLTAALYLDPAYAPAYFARGNILHERGLYYLALADYDQALANGHPEKYRVHYARALLFSALNSLPRTKEALYAALREKPDFQPARKRLAAILGGNLSKTRLFADLVKRPKKRIVARIQAPAAGHAVAAAPRTAAVMIAGAPVLTLRKPPQAAPVAPPDPAAMASGAPKVPARPASGAATKAWRVASTRPVAPTAVADAAREKAKRSTATDKPGHEGKDRNDKAGGASFRTASISPAPASAKAQPPSASVKARPEYTGWAIQLAAQRSENAARAHWNRLKGKVRRRTRAGKLAIIRAEVPGRGVFYRIRLVGFADRKAARRHCRNLKRGHVSCLVVPAGG